MKTGSGEVLAISIEVWKRRTGEGTQPVLLHEEGGQVGGSLTELSDHPEILPQTFI